MPSPTPGLRRCGVALALLSGSFAGCRSPVGVTSVEPQAMRAELDAGVLTTGRPGALSIGILEYVGLRTAYASDPDGTLVALHRLAVAEGRLGPYAALAELQYARALGTRRRGDFLAAALFAQCVFFDTELTGDISPFSAWFRQTAEIYNRSLERVFTDARGRLELRDESIETPVGVVHVQASRPGFPWGPEDFDEFRLADGFRIRGLRERVRISGLGAPVVAVHTGDTRKGSLSTLTSGQRVTLPATVFLRVQGNRHDLLAGRIETDLELYLTLDQSQVEQNGRSVPLDADLTAPLALSLENSALWSFELAGFLSGRTDAFRTGITMLQPYQPGKVPLLLIHGTASSPATWAQIINSLLADSALRDRYQIWMSLYNTGNPTYYSASQQRAALRELLADLDPQGRDPALQHVVLVGHSQGGLVARLLVSDSGERLWDMNFDVPAGQLEDSPQDVAEIQAALVFEAVPQVDRVVFVSTPHRGSFVASSWLGRLASELVSVPSDLADSMRNMAKNAVSRNSGKNPLLEGLPTSVQNMQPGSRFIEGMQLLEFNPRVHLHSIIAGPASRVVPGSDDSVVSYESAHLEGVESELVFQGTHFDQNSPPVVAELRRILREHLAGLPEPAAAAAP